MSKEPDLYGLIGELLNTAKELAAKKDDPDTEVDISNYDDAFSNILRYYEGVIQRQDKILDRKKLSVFSDVLNLTTRGQVERALTSFNYSYLLGLNLSLEATSELAENLIQLANKYKLPIPEAWSNAASYKNDIGVIKTKLRHIRDVPEF